MVFLSITWVEFLLSRKAFTAESVYVYTYEMFTELRKRRYLGKTSQSKHGISHVLIHGLRFILIDVTCHHSGCDQPLTPTYHLIGPTVVVNWTCPSCHKGKFASSEEVNGIYANNLEFAALILLSGNNFAKIERMCSFLGLSFFSTFFRVQRVYLIPCICEWWSWQRDQLLEEFKHREVVVCGDGQCDSPGHSAKNLCYFLMELVSGYILEIEVRDKRHVGLSSANMEKQALQNALQRLRLSLNIVEVVTDASPTIKKLIGKQEGFMLHSEYN